MAQEERGEERNGGGDGTSWDSSGKREQEWETDVTNPVEDNNNG